MKYDITFKVMGHFLFHATSPSLTSSERSAAFSEYRKIISRSKEIGNPNPLSSAYALGAWFIAMNRSDSRSAEENCEIMAHALQNSRLLRIAMGDADHYLDPKRIQKFCNGQNPPIAKLLKTTGSLIFCPEMDPLTLVTIILNAESANCVVMRDVRNMQNTYADLIIFLPMLWG